MVLPLEKEVVGEHSGIVLDPLKGFCVSHSSQQSDGHKRPETRGKRATLSHASLAGDPDIRLGTCRPIPDVLMQRHDKGKLRLRYTGRLEFALKNTSINRVKGLARVYGQCDTTPTRSGDAPRGASLL